MKGIPKCISTINLNKCHQWDNKISHIYYAITAQIFSINVALLISWLISWTDWYIIYMNESRIIIKDKKSWNYFIKSFSRYLISVINFIPTLMDLLMKIFKKNSSKYKNRLR